MIHKKVIENLIENGYAETHVGYHAEYRFWLGDWRNGYYAQIAAPYQEPERIYADSYKALLQKLANIGILPYRFTVTQTATWTGFNRSYIKAEIARGNLKAELIGNWAINAPDFLEWLDKPRRGSRTK